MRKFIKLNSAAFEGVIYLNVEKIECISSFKDGSSITTDSNEYDVKEDPIEILHKIDQLY